MAKQEVEYDATVYVHGSDPGDIETVKIDVWVSTSDDPDCTVMEIHAGHWNGTGRTYDMAVLNDQQLDELIDALQGAKAARERVTGRIREVRYAD